MNDPMGIGEGATEGERIFRAHLDQIEAPRVLELGTLRWEADRPTHHQEWAPHAADYVMSDVEAGPDVDVVADAHHLTGVFRPHSFDAVICVSVFEHLRRPWVAARELMPLVRPGGVLYVATHQTFPLHGYPHDYFRFSAEALASLFESRCDILHAGYAYPCQIVPPAEVTRWNAAAPAWLNVEVAAIRR